MQTAALAYLNHTCVMIIPSVLPAVPMENGTCRHTDSTFPRLTALFTATFFAATATTAIGYVVSSDAAVQS
jgi:hypothetical protein